MSDLDTFTLYCRDGYADTSAANYPDDRYSITLPTEHGKPIPGIYTGWGGHKIIIEELQSQSES